MPNVKRVTESILRGKDVRKALSITEAVDSSLLQKIHDSIDGERYEEDAEDLAKAFANHEVWGAYYPDFTVDPFAITSYDDNGFTVEYVFGPKETYSWDDLGKFLDNVNFDFGGDYSSTSPGMDYGFDTLDDVKAWVKEAGEYLGRPVKLNDIEEVDGALSVDGLMNYVNIGENAVEMDVDPFGMTPEQYRDFKEFIDKVSDIDYEPEGYAENPDDYDELLHKEVEDYIKAHGLSKAVDLF